MTDASPGETERPRHHSSNHCDKGRWLVWLEMDSLIALELENSKQNPSRFYIELYIQLAEPRVFRQLKPWTDILISDSSRCVRPVLLAPANQST